MATQNVSPVPAQIPTLSSRREKITKVCSAIKHVWAFLENYLAMANTHGAEFISHGHWDQFVPVSAQHQLLCLSQEELVNLPDYDPCNTKTAKPSVSVPEKVMDSTKDGNQWLHDFIREARSCRLDRLGVLCTLSECTSSSTVNVRDVGVISEAMSEKKMHEVEVMLVAVAAMLSSCKADIVIDVGSGKGYLSCELAGRYQLPVVGLDSQHSNTHSASRRDQQQRRRWKGLARRKQKMRNSSNLQSSSNNSSSSKCQREDNLETEEDFLHKNLLNVERTARDTLRNCHENMSGCSADQADGHVEKLSISSDVDSNFELASNNKSAYFSSQPSAIDRLVSGHFVGDSTATLETYSGGCSRDVCGPDCITNSATQFTRTAGGLGVKQPSLRTVRNDSSSMTQKKAEPPSETTPNSLYVPLTQFVHPQMDLRQFLQNSANHLCRDICPSSLQILLTGLHTCGSLAVTLMNLFLQDSGAVGLCCVGCCYQLMEEVCAGTTPIASSAPVSSHFPLSQFGQQLRLHLGRNARNLASQSVHRTQVSGQNFSKPGLLPLHNVTQLSRLDMFDNIVIDLWLHLGSVRGNYQILTLMLLQGRQFYWRALLDVLLIELNIPMPERIVGLRGLNKQSSSFKDYAVAALKKLHLSPDLMSEETLEEIKKRHTDDLSKMAAFFQLKLVLSPVIETLILLDRFLFLLEQECVEWAQLVQLFDPLTSPRCFALLVKKSRQSSDMDH